VIRDPQRERDGVTNAVGFFEHDIVREAKQFDPKPSQVLGPALVVHARHLFEMLAAVEFDRQTVRWAIEVEDVRTAGVLAPKFETGEAFRAKPAPESGLGVSEATA
jgi:hypothetical protein